MRRFYWLLVAIAVLGTSLPATAQFRDLKINIPFAFQIGDTKLDAGEYTFTQETRNDKMLVVGKKGRMLIPTSPLPPESPADKAHTTLIWHKADGQHFLWQLWTKHLGFQMPTAAAEKELITSGTQPSELKMNVKMQ